MSSQNPRVPTALKSNVTGVRVHYSLLWLSVNSLSSPVNGSSEGRWPKANVGVHSYIITKGLPVASSTSSVLLFSVILWFSKNCILSHMQGWWSYHWVTLTTFVFHGSVYISCFFYQAISERAEMSDKPKTRAEVQVTTPRPDCYSINAKGCSSYIHGVVKLLWHDISNPARNIVFSSRCLG